MLRGIRLSMAPASLLLIWNCGGSSSAEPSNPDAGLAVDAAPKADGATGLDANATDAGAADSSNVQDTSTADVSSCTPGGLCASNPGAPCVLGKVACASGVAQCVDDVAAVNGTACTSGLCSLGTCSPATSITADTNLSQVPIAAGRTCADGVSFAVTSLTATSATLATAPASGCLAAGDTVLLINQQGSSAGTTNVGNWEVLEVASATASTVTFTTSKTKSYGATAGVDTGIGAGATDQKVALYRVPTFGDLTIASGKTLTADAWDGAKGGVVALSAGKLLVEGKISATGLGYRSGRWSQDDFDCDDNVASESGESFTGPALVTTAANGGAAGGIAAASNISFGGDTPISAGAGHAQAGEVAKNPKGRTLGAAGAAYGVNDGTKLTMGSGTTSNLTCAVNGTAGGALLNAFAPTAGGIVLIFTGEATVGASGAITASAADGGRDVSASGGYVYIKGTALSLGADKVTAQGATGTSVNVSGTFGGQTVKSSDGYIVLDAATVTGTTKPASNNL